MHSMTIGWLVTTALVLVATQAEGAPQVVACTGQNDRLAIQAAIDTGDAELLGTCVVRPHNGGGPILSIAPGQRLSGRGAELRIQDGELVSGARGVLLANRDRSTNAILPGEAPVIEGLTFSGNIDGNPEPATPPELIALHRVRNAKLDGLVVRDTWGTAIAVHNGFGSAVTRNSIRRSRRAIDLQGDEQPRVALNQLWNVREGIVIQATTSPDVGTDPGRYVVAHNTAKRSTTPNAACLAQATPFPCCTGNVAGTGTGDCAPAQTLVGEYIVAGGTVGLIQGNVARGFGGIVVAQGRPGNPASGGITWNTTVSANVLLEGATGICGKVISHNSSAMDATLLSANQFDDCGLFVITTASTLAAPNNVTMTDTEVTNSRIVVDPIGGQSLFGNLTFRNTRCNGGTEPCIEIGGGALGVDIVGTRATNWSGPLYAFGPGSQDVYLEASAEATLGELQTYAASATLEAGSEHRCTNCLRGSNPCTTGGSGGVKATYVDGAWRC